MKKNFEGEDDQDVQSNMENVGDFPEQEGLQKNEEDELLQDNLNDEFGEESTNLSRNWISKDCNSKFTERRIRRRSAGKSDVKKSRKVTKAAENYV